MVRAAPGGALARGGKGAKNAENLKKNSRENSDCKFHMCLRARKTKRCGIRPHIGLYPQPTYCCALLSANWDTNVTVDIT